MGSGFCDKCKQYVSFGDAYGLAFNLEVYSGHKRCMMQLKQELQERRKGEDYDRTTEDES